MNHHYLNQIDLKSSSTLRNLLKITLHYFIKLINFFVKEWMADELISSSSQSVQVSAISNHHSGRLRTQPTLTNPTVCSLITVHEKYFNN
jgi:hypothetical protein